LIAGIGIDLCSIARMAEALERTPALSARVFHPSEESLPINSLAGRFAAKEALAKAIGNPKLLVWNEIEVVKDELGKPSFVFHGKTKLEIEILNVRCLLSISHELELATAMVVLEAL